MIKNPGTGGFFILKIFRKMRKTEGSLISKYKKTPDFKVMFIKSDNCPTLVLTLFSSMIILMLGKPNEDSFVESL